MELCPDTLRVSARPDVVKVASKVCTLVGLEARDGNFLMIQGKELLGSREMVWFGTSKFVDRFPICHVLSDTSAEVIMALRKALDQSRSARTAIHFCRRLYEELGDEYWLLRR